MTEPGAVARQKRPITWHAPRLIDTTLRVLLWAKAVLVLCRGLFTPGHNDTASRTQDNVHGAALRSQEGDSLAEAFAEVTCDGSSLDEEHIDSLFRFLRFRLAFAVWETIPLGLCTRCPT